MKKAWGLRSFLFFLPHPNYLRIFPLFLLLPVLVSAQDFKALNTARNCSYMKPAEREMIAEINLVRSDPPGYAKYLSYYYEMAKLNLEHYGKGKKSYSLSITYEKVNGVGHKKKVDTVWTNEYQEEVHAIESLLKDLYSTPPLSILQPDNGIYEAARKHGLDQDRHNWSLGHMGSDGSWPWERIMKYSPRMVAGNENLAGRFPEPTAREIVIQLLIDAGIPEYGHRYNMLDPKWTHVACYTSGLKGEMYQWIQEFGEMK
ncbi:MAG: hypothetical protein NTW10_11745 [Bacteroidetes bacterium]|nr:hypothetical protein [Bacteroidota bacterium]